MSDELNGKTIAFLVANEGIEQVELTRPWKAIEDAGGQPILLAPGAGRGAGLRPSRQGGRLRRRPGGRRGRRERLRRAGPAGGVANPDNLRTRPEAARLRPRLLRGRQAGRGDLPRALDADRGRRRRRAQADLVAEPADRSAQRRRGVGRRGGRGRPGPRHLAQARTTWTRSAPRPSRRSARACTRSSARRRSRKSWVIREGAGSGASRSARASSSAAP